MGQVWSSCCPSRDHKKLLFNLFFRSNRTRPITAKPFEARDVLNCSPAFIDESDEEEEVKVREDVQVNEAVIPPPIPPPLPKWQPISSSSSSPTSSSSSQCSSNISSQSSQPKKPLVFLTKLNSSGSSCVSSANSSPANHVIQASTSDLLRAIARFLSIKYCIDENDVISWLRSVDRALLVQGWQDLAFISPSNLVFLFLLLQRALQILQPQNPSQVKAVVLTCLYLSYSYEGNEISYPLKPFLLEEDSRAAFFSRAILVMNSCSGSMLKINRDPSFFTQTFTDLLVFSQQHSSSNAFHVNNGFH